MPDSTSTQSKRGRFAPSPTGPLHFGSLVAAVGSYLHVRSAGGQWLVRIEDIDPPREQAGAADAILRALEVHGLQWDGPVVYQSQRTEQYQATLDSLDSRQLTYYCDCSRKLLVETGDKNQWGRRYPGTCRQRHLRNAGSIRILTNNRPITINDLRCGNITHKLEQQTGDFIVRRRDGLIAYHLAVVVDDADQNITEVVRGHDLLDVTALHIHLQQSLSLPTPDYLHLPVAVTVAGQKLSKQNLVKSLDTTRPEHALVAVLQFLGQSPPVDLSTATVTDIMAWATQHWSADRLPAQNSIIYEGQ